MTPLLSLIGVAKHPQGLGRMAEAANARGLPVKEYMRVRLLSVREGYTLLRVSASQGKFSKIEQGHPKHPVCHQEGGWVVLMLGHAKALRCQLSCDVYLPPYQITLPQAEQYVEELRGFAGLLAELPRPGIGLLDFRGSHALGRHQCWTKRDLHSEFLLEALGGVRQSLEQRQSPGKVRDSLPIGIALQGILGGLLAIVHRPGVLPSLLKVYGQLYGEGSRRLPVTCHQPLPNPPMQAQTPRRRYPVVDGLLVERVDEIIARRHGPVWPGPVSTRPEPLSTPCQALTPRFDLLDVYSQTSGHDGSGKLVSHHASDLKHSLFFGA